MLPKSSFPVQATAVSLWLLVSCGGGQPLSYEEAMNLLRERAAEPIKTNFNASPRAGEQDPKVIEAYKKLTDSHVIECKPNATVGTLCEPGAAGTTLTQNGVSEITFVAGRWVPQSIVAIQRTGRSSASADVRMVFEPSPLFSEFEEAFDLLQSPGANSTMSTRKQGKVVKANFQRYEDGWHVESVD